MCMMFNIRHCIIILYYSGFVFCYVTPTNISKALLTYEGYIKSSHVLDKSDKALLKNWTAVFRVNQVNITSHYRLEMTRHKEHSFNRIDSSKSWLDCLSLHEKELRKSERVYYSSETDCLKIASVADHGDRRAVHQVTKEIKKWRKSYRYLVNQCHLDNPGNEEAAGLCLVEYMQRDHYDITFQRLINLKQKCIAEVYVKMAYGSNALEQCLKACLSRYLDTVRSVMDNLNTCYSIKNKS